MPAATGVSPAISCRCCDTKKRKPTSAMTLNRLMSTAPPNEPWRNSRMSSIGELLRSWRCTNHAPATRPSTIMAAPTAVNPSVASDLMP